MYTRALLLATCLLPLSYGGGNPCPGMIPSQTTASQTTPQNAFCMEVLCGQSYGETYTYACDLPAPNKRCGAGDVVISRLYGWKCLDGQCTENNKDTMGRGLSRETCD